MTFKSIISTTVYIVCHEKVISLLELKLCLAKGKENKGQKATAKVKQRYHENSAWPEPAFGQEKPGYSSPEGTQPHTFVPF